MVHKSVCRLDFVNNMETKNTIKSITNGKRLSSTYGRFTFYKHFSVTFLLYYGGETLSRANKVSKGQLLQVRLIPIL